ncbi:MAG TPA: hypothetical protein DHU26_02225 [Spirochaetaceae bacterium]|nr:hypothetical protein [Spirochaetaceae bacterium]
MNEAMIIGDQTAIASIIRLVEQAQQFKSHTRIEGDSENTIARAICESVEKRSLLLPEVHSFEAIKGRGALAHDSSQMFYVGRPCQVDFFKCFQLIHLILRFLWPVQ